MPTRANERQEQNLEDVLRGTIITLLSHPALDTSQPTFPLAI
jgi:hypothetical protein